MTQVSFLTGLKVYIGRLKRCLVNDEQGMVNDRNLLYIYISLYVLIGFISQSNNSREVEWEISSYIHKSSQPFS